MTADPYAVCLECAQHHRFFIMPDTPGAAATEQASSANLPHAPTEDPTAIARFWLSDHDARSMLNGQLAELLRVILDGSAILESLSFSYCPICGGKLADYEQRDVWVRGLRCPDSHVWFERGGKLFGRVDGEALELHAEPADSVVRKLISGWLTNSVLRSNLHPSIRKVLDGSRYASGAT